MLQEGSDPLGSLDFARDFGSGLGRPLGASTSTSRRDSQANRAAALRMTNQTDSLVIRRSEMARHTNSECHSAILAKCKSKPVLGSREVSSKALKPSPVISVWRYRPGSVSTVSLRPSRSSKNC